MGETHLENFTVIVYSSRIFIVKFANMIKRFFFLNVDIISLDVLKCASKLCSPEEVYVVREVEYITTCFF